MMTRRTFAAAAAAPLLGACRNAGPSPNSGWRRAPDAPYAVQEIYPALHDGAIWIAGGFAPLAALGATRRVIVFNPAHNTWSEGPNLPEPAHHVHLASLNGALWAIGGFLGGDNRRRWICTARVLKLAGESWIEGPALPKPIGEAVPVVHAGRIHLIGGRAPRGAAANLEWDDQGDVDDHFVLTPESGAWARAAPLPLARNSAAGMSHDGRIHVISGRTVAGGQTGAHHIYDANADRWATAPDYPDPRGGLAAAVWNGRLVAGGGEIFEPPSVSDALHAYDDSGWRRFETMPSSRHGHGMIAAGAALHLIGGAQNVGGRDTLARVDTLSAA